MIKNNHPDKVPSRAAFSLLAGAMMGLAGAMTGGYSQASDYNYPGSRQDQSRIQSSDYATRWARDTRPWSREAPGTGQSRLDGSEAGYPVGYDQWANESSRGNWDSDRTYHANEPWGNFRQSDGWYRDDRPGGVARPPETGRETGHRGHWDKPRAPGRQDDPWPTAKDPSGPDRWTDSQPGGNTSWFRDNRFERPGGAYGGTPPPTTRHDRSDWSQSPEPAPPRDYTSGGAAAARDPWARDPWPERGSRHGARMYIPNTNSPRSQEYWESGQDPYKEDRPWGRRHRSDRPRAEQPPAPTANTYNAPSADVRQPGYHGYPEYYSAPYPGAWEYGSMYDPGYGSGYYGLGAGHGLGGWYPGLWNTPGVGDSLWFPF